MYYLYKKAKARKQRLNAEAIHGDGPDASVAPTDGVHSGDEMKENEADPALKGPSKEEQQRQKSAMRKYRYKLIAGLFFPYFIASTDVTSMMLLHSLRSEIDEADSRLFSKSSQRPCRLLQITSVRLDCLADVVPGLLAMALTRCQGNWINSTGS